MNVFHCCTHKTASQWVRAIFSDSRIQEFSGLKPYYYEEEALAKYGIRKPSEKVFDKPFPDNTIITPLYADYSSFCRARSMSSSQTFAFFVTRDPRDMLVSWYFSMKYSHEAIIDDVTSIRNILNSKSEKEGLRQSIHLLASFDLFESIRSWVDASLVDKNIILVKYEDLTSEDNTEVFMKLFRRLDLYPPEGVLRDVLAEHRFERLTGRKKGLQDPQAHLRKGIEGDWINFIDDELMEELQSVAGDLSEELGYKSRNELIKQNLQLYQNLASEIYSDLCVVKTDLDTARTELIFTRDELSAVKHDLFLKQAHLEKANQDLLQTQEELAASREELAASRLVINRKSATIKRLKSRISDQESELREAKRNIRVLESKVKQIEASKLWKLKKFWAGLTRRSFEVWL